jgi:hypothetical protein
MNQPVYDWFKKALVALGNDTTTLKTRWVGLYTNLAGGPSPNQVLANITEANYTGYVRQVLGAWGTPYTSIDGHEAMNAPALTFLPSDTVTSNTILGAFIGDASVAGNLLLTDQFANPVPLTGPTTSLTIVPRFGFDPAANYDFNVVID